MPGSILAGALTGIGQGYLQNKIDVREEDDRLKAGQLRDLQLKNDAEDRAANARSRAQKEVEYFGNRLMNIDYLRATKPDVYKSQIDMFNAKAVPLGLLPIDFEGMFRQLGAIIVDEGHADTAAGYSPEAVTERAKRKNGEWAILHFPELAPPAPMAPTAPVPLPTTAPNALTAGALALGGGALQPAAAQEFMSGILAQGNGPVAPPAPNPPAGALIERMIAPVNPLRESWSTLTPAQEPIAAPVSQPAGTLAQAPAPAPKSSFDTLMGGGGTRPLRKDQEAYAKTLRTGIQNGSISSKNAQESWRSMYSDTPIPADIPGMTPTAQTTSVINKPGIDAKKESKRQFAKDFGDVMTGDMTKDGFRQLHPGIEPPGLSVKAGLSIEQIKANMDLAGKRYGLSEEQLGIAKERLTLSKNADARAANKAAQPGKTKESIPDKMTPGNRDAARKTGYGDYAIKYGPAEVLNNMKYLADSGAKPAAVASAVKTIRDKYNAKYGGGAGKPATAGGGASFSQVKRDIAEIRKVRPGVSDEIIKRALARTYNGKPEDYAGAVSGRK